MRSACLLLSGAAILACGPTPSPSGPGAPARIAVLIRACEASRAEAAPAGAPATPTAPNPATPAAPTPPPPPPAAGTATVRPGTVTSTGLPPDEIQRIVRVGSDRMLACYRSALAGAPGLEGKLVLQIRIGLDGAVTKVDTQVGFAAAVDACVADVVRTLRFPAGKVESAVTLPLRFQLDDAPPPAPPAPTASAPDAGVPPPAQPPPPAWTGDLEGYAREVVGRALEERADAIAACSPPSSEPVQRGLDVTLRILPTAQIDDVRIVGLVDPAMTTCIAGVVRGVVVAAPTTPVVARCSVVLEPR